MSWSSLSGDEVPNHSEVVEGVANKDLKWDSSAPSLNSNFVYTRNQYETYLKNSSMSFSGITFYELMTKDEMLLYSDTSPNGPPSSLIAQNASICSGGSPIWQVSLSWTNGDSQCNTQFEYKETGTSLWYYLGSADPGVTNKTFRILDGGMGSYNIRAWHQYGASNSSYAQTFFDIVIDPCGGGGPGDPL